MKMDGLATPSWRFLLALFAVLFAVQIVLYAEGFWVQPAGDDFGPPLTEIARGQQQGPLIFFTESAKKQLYRPLASTLVWAFVSISDEHRIQWYRVLHFFCFAFYAAAAMLWLRWMPIGLAGAMVAAAIVFLHPVLTGPVGGIDGFDGAFATAFMWFGALAVLVFRDRLAMAAGMAGLCFLIAGLTKEYAFGLGPLAVWTALMFSRQHPWRNGFVVGVSVTAALALVLFFRSKATGIGTQSGMEFVSVDPVGWVRNVALLATSLIFMGSTAWVALRGDAVGMAVLGGLSLLMAALLLAGCWWFWRAQRASAEGRAAAADDPAASHGRWVTYLVLALPMAAATPILTPRVSEMYSVGLVLPFALLVGVAIEGWMRQPRRVRRVGAAAFIALVGIGALSAHSKVAMLRTTGERADVQLRALLATLPPDARDGKVAVLTIRSEIEAQPAYSIYVHDDHARIGQPWAMNWIAPQRRLTLEHLMVDDVRSFDTQPYDHVVLWRSDAQAYELIK